MAVKVITDMLREHVSKVLRVHTFLLTIVLRKRFKQKQAAIAKLQNFFRVVKAKMETRQRRTAIKEKERRRRMEIFTRLSKDQAKLDAAAKLIQDVIFTCKIKQKKEGKELRQKLKDLPYVCRSSFLKMHFLKAQTAQLKNNVSLKLRR